MSRCNSPVKSPRKTPKKGNQHGSPTKGLDTPPVSSHPKRPVDELTNGQKKRQKEDGTSGLTNGEGDGIES